MPSALRPPTRTDNATLLLMDAILVLSGDLGYSSVSVESVLQHAGVSRGAFYGRFRDKRHCFESAFLNALEKLQSDLLRAASPWADWENAVSAAIAELLRTAAERPIWMRAMLVESYGAGLAVAKARDAAIQQLARTLDRLTSGDPALDGQTPTAVTTVVIGGVIEVLRSHLMNNDPEDPRALLPDLVQFLVGAYLGPERGLEQGRRVLGAITQRERCSAVA